MEEQISDSHIIDELYTNTKKRGLELINKELLALCYALREENVRLKEENARLSELAYIDPLTGLYNRRMMDSDDQETFIIVMCDIDKFKDINDKFGHQYGDTVLQIISRILKSETRNGDVITRHGGDEFLVRLKGKNIDVVFDKFKQISTIFCEECKKELKLDVTMSFGIVEYDPNHCTLDDAINYADEALYESKRNGRNKGTIYKKKN